MLISTAVDCFRYQLAKRDTAHWPEEIHQARRKLRPGLCVLFCFVAGLLDDAKSEADLAEALSHGWTIAFGLGTWTEWDLAEAAQELDRESDRQYLELKAQLQAQQYQPHFDDAATRNY